MGATAPSATASQASAEVRATGVESVGPIDVAAAGSGPLFSAGPAEVAVMPDGGVASGDRPFIAVPRAMEKSSDLAVRVVDAAQPGNAEGAVVWTGRLIDGWTQVSTSLPPGGAYRVDVSADASKWDPVGWFVVRGAWATGGTDVAVGGVSVSQVSGRASWAWQSATLPGPVGAGRLSLGWTSGWAAPDSLRQSMPQGLPSGWRLAVGNGSNWVGLLLSQQDGIARVVGWDGSVLVFKRNGSGVWVQTTGGAPGFANELQRVDADTWQFIAADGIISRFEGSGGVFRVSRVFSKGTQISTVTWDDRQRISSVTNEVNRTLRLSYADGANSCPSQGWTASGWSAVPNGMLCQVIYPDGSASEFGYVSGVAGAAQIGIVKDPGNVAATLGWDARGRLLAERGSFANRVALVDPDAAKVVTTLGYDGQGRATSVAIPGGSTQRLTFPAVTEQTLRAWVKNRDAAAQSAPVAARTTLQASGFDMSRTSFLDPTTWVTLKAQDATGAQMRLELDSRGRVSRQVDDQGRVTTYTHNDLGLVTATSGPSAPGSQAAKTGQNFDTRTERREQVDLVGLRALVGSGAARKPEFWPATVARGAISYSWNGREASWAGQATGVWNPSDAEEEAATKAGGWTFRVDSDGAQVTFRVGGRVCKPASNDRCDMGPLPGGLKHVSVDVTGARQRGWFSVQAGPRYGNMRVIPLDRVTPGYGLVTETTTNDVFPGRSQNPLTVTQYADPASGQPSSVTAPGDLTSRYDYGTDRWQRLRKVTTPGGATQETTYWPDNAEVQVPEMCGGVRVRVSGQVRSVTRQDGTVVTTWPDLSDRIVAKQMVGREGARQTQCFTFFADGSVESARTFDAAGALVEFTVNDPAVGGDYRVAKSTVTKGAGAGAVALDEVWTKTRYDMFGRVVETSASSGVTTTRAYNGLGLASSATTTAEDGTVLTVAYTYRGKDAQIETVTVNNVLAAKVAYDSKGRVASVAYPSGLSQSFTYDPQGRPSGLSVRLGSQSWTHAVDRTAFGRILGETLARDGVREERSYTYDSGSGRLSKATIASSEGAMSTWRYGFGGEDSSCSTDGYMPGKDGLRTGGSRDGAAYVTCHDASGRVESTTDPLVTGGAAIARVTHDGFGRVTSITGNDPVKISWGLGSSMTRLVQGGDDTADITMEDFAGTNVLRTVATATGTESVRFSGPFTLASGAAGAAGAVIATQYSLPGGVQVTVASGTATATLPDLGGSAMATLALPALAGTTAEVGSLEPAPRFGPYGEPLAAAPDSDAIRDYTWRAGMGLETLPGSSSITVMGARHYHPGLGEFLTPDPLIDGGDALYAYTSGDPINYRDPSGGSEEAGWDTWLAAIGGGVAAIVAGAAGWRAAVSTNLVGAKAATWLAGIAGAAAVAGGGYLAVKAGADSDTGLMIAGFAIAAVGATSGYFGVVKGVENVRVLRFKSDLIKRPNAVRMDADWKFQIFSDMGMDEGAVVGRRSSAASSVRSSIVREVSPVEQIPAMKVSDFQPNTSVPLSAGDPTYRPIPQDAKEKLLRWWINNTDWSTTGRLPRSSF